MIEQAYSSDKVAAVTCRYCRKVTLTPVSYEWVELWGRRTFCPVFVCCDKQQRFNDPYAEEYD